MRTRAALLALAASALVLTGCSREIDAGAAGGQPVPGMPGTFWTCHGPVMIYFYSASDGRPDGIEGMFYGTPECTGEATQPQPNGQ